MAASCVKYEVSSLQDELNSKTEILKAYMDKITREKKEMTKNLNGCKDFFQTLKSKLKETKNIVDQMKQCENDTNPTYTIIKVRGNFYYNEDPTVKLIKVDEKEYNKLMGIQETKGKVM